MDWKFWIDIGYARILQPCEFSGYIIFYDEEEMEGVAVKPEVQYCFAQLLGGYYVWQCNEGYGSRMLRSPPRLESNIPFDVVNPFYIAAMQTLNVDSIWYFKEEKIWTLMTRSRRHYTYDPENVLREVRPRGPAARAKEWPYKGYLILSAKEATIYLGYLAKVRGCQPTLTKTGKDEGVLLCWDAGFPVIIERFPGYGCLIAIRLNGGRYIKPPKGEPVKTGDDIIQLLTS